MVVVECLARIEHAAGSLLSSGVGSRQAGSQAERSGRVAGK